MSEENKISKHLKFEELYNNLQMKVDEVAERILTLGLTPAHTYSEYMKQSQIKEVSNSGSAKKCVESVMESFWTLILMERKILEPYSDAGDEGSNALMSDYIREQEKLVWMYGSWLEK